jgi:hypothetical protein
MDGQKKLKSLEFKIRTYNPSQERQDQRDVSRVYYNGDTILDMELKTGQPCYMWKIEDVESQRREAVVWQAYQNINKNVVQMNKTFQEACGFKYEDRIAVAPAPSLQYAHCVVLRDVTVTASLSVRDRPHWEWCLEDKLGMHLFFSGGLYFLVIVQSSSSQKILSALRTMIKFWFLVSCFSFWSQLLNLWMNISNYV